MQEIDVFLSAFESRDAIGIGVIIVLFLIAGYRGFKDFHFLSHPRYRIKAIIGAGIFFVTLFVWSMRWISDFTFFILLLLWVEILLLMILSLKKIIWPFSHIFSKILLSIKAGDDERAKNLLSCYSWFCIDPLMQYEWRLLCARNHLIKENPKKAFETILSFDEKYLFEEEKASFNLTKAEYFVLLGNYKGALEVLFNLKNVEGDLILRRAHAIAICYEMRGDIAAASDTLISAISSFTNSSSESLPPIFNDLGQMRKLEGNSAEAFHYYEKAAHSAVAAGSKHLLHVSYQNLIESNALEGDFTTAEKWIDDYRTHIYFTNVNDLLEFFNLQLAYYRQKSDKDKIILILEKGRSALYSKLTDRQKIKYDIDELRIRWNSQLLKPSYLTHIEQQFDKYLQLDLTLRYYSLNEINRVLRELKISGQLGIFIAFHERVISHLNGMESEIEKHLLSLPEFCVDEKCYWVKELMALQKNNPNNYNHEKVLKSLIDLKESRMKYGNYLAGLDAGLDICDEAMYQQKKLIVTNYLQQTLKEIATLPVYSIRSEWYIRIARYAYDVGQTRCANEMFNNFLRSNVSIDHFAFWIKGYHDFLSTHLIP
ncbi:hypothetical protein [Methanoregula sp.]|uniref:hypothetical protein n=1 Tax=Methanoregula sp. TaxID=2052170 RepID=UPI00260CF568|nr:hypothetical protein [Methanoregula sp.]MDD5144279.1 hypothetical protein [Methanoregula sp.]